MGIGNFFTPINNWKVLLLSFLGASTFWFFSALGKQYNTRIKHPIAFVYNSDSLVAMQPLAEFVELDVSGGGWDLFRHGFWFNLKPIFIEPENPVNVKFLSRSTIIPMVRDHLSQFEINFLYTDTLFLDFEQKISKHVQLAIDSTEIALEEGYRITSPVIIKPDTAMIYGPKSFIDTLASKYFIPIEKEGVDRNFNQMVSLGLVNGFSIASTPKEVKTVFTVEQFEDLQLPVELELLNFTEDSSATPSSNEVTVRFVVQRSLKEDFFADDFKVILDFDMMNKEDSTIPPIVMIHPENVIEVEVEPDTVKVIYHE